MERVITCQTSQGLKLRASLSRLTRFLATFEVYDPQLVLRQSEVLGGVEILVQEQVVYAGRAVISSLVHTATGLVCEATLEEGWQDVKGNGLHGNGSPIQASFETFWETARNSFKLLPEFKLAVADLQLALGNLRLWFEQLELEQRIGPGLPAEGQERRLLGELGTPVISLLDDAFERFEAACERIDEERRPAHRAYVKRLLHPFVLCAPFMHRTYFKPLGYAGDYEMVNMMTRSPYEGGSLFAKMLNAFFLNTPPVAAHRNRLELLTQYLLRETCRASLRGRPARILNLGCGPAREIQDFMAASALADQAQFTLLDFNQETVQYAQAVLAEARRQHGRKTGIVATKKSAAQFLVENRRAAAREPYDVIYCAGLFDYLPDHVCRQVLQLFCQLAAPGGLVLVTNVDSSNPSRHWMEYAVDWHLLHRDGRALAALAPREAGGFEPGRVVAERSGVNIFLELRKQGHA